MQDCLATSRAKPLTRIRWDIYSKNSHLPIPPWKTREKLRHLSIDLPEPEHQIWGTKGKLNLGKTAWKICHLVPPCWHTRSRVAPKGAVDQFLQLTSQSWPPRCPLATLPDLKQEKEKQDQGSRLLMKGPAGGSQRAPTRKGWVNKRDLGTSMGWGYNFGKSG